MPSTALTWDLEPLDLGLQVGQHLVLHLAVALALLGLRLQVGRHLVLHFAVVHELHGLPLEPVGLR